MRGRPKRPLLNGEPICKMGHPVVGDNARITYFKNGVAYYACRKCYNRCAAASKQARKLKKESSDAPVG